MDERMIIELANIFGHECGRIERETGIPMGDKYIYNTVWNVLANKKISPHLSRRKVFESFKNDGIRMINKIALRRMKICKCINVN